MLLRGSGTTEASQTQKRDCFATARNDNGNPVGSYRELSSSKLHFIGINSPDNSFNSTSNIEVADHFCPYRSARLYYVIKNFICHMFVELSCITIRKHIEFKRF